jgi:hypothetical protein
VAQRVVDEIRGQAFGEARAAGCPCRAEVGVQRQVPVFGFGSAGGEDLAGQGGQIEGFLFVQACLPACPREQRFDELFVLGAGCEHPLVRCAECFDGGAGIGEGDLADDPLPGQRGAQLV